MTGAVPDPRAILDFWFGDAAGDPEKAKARGRLWFEASREIDALVCERFTSWIEAAARAELWSWLGDPRSALARVVLLDQLPRNAWRGTARAFACDTLALATAEHATAQGYLAALSPVEQSFLVLPFEHSESISRQRASVRLTAEILAAAPPPWRPLVEGYHTYAVQHHEIVARFGRFPHRNTILGRASSAEEVAYLGGGGATFGQQPR